LRGVTGVTGVTGVARGTYTGKREIVRNGLKAFGLRQAFDAGFTTLADREDHALGRKTVPGRARNFLTTRAQYRAPASSRTTIDANAGRRGNPLRVPMFRPNRIEIAARPGTALALQISET